MQEMSLIEYGKFIQNIHRDWTNKWWNKVTSGLAIDITEVVRPDSLDSNRVEFGISWASLGDKTLTTAKKFQAQLQEAIVLVEQLNEQFENIEIK